MLELFVLVGLVFAGMVLLLPGAPHARRPQLRTVGQIRRRGEAGRPAHYRVVPARPRLIAPAPAVMAPAGSAWAAPEGARSAAPRAVSAPAVPTPALAAWSPSAIPAWAGSVAVPESDPMRFVSDAELRGLHEPNTAEASADQVVAGLLSPAPGHS